MIICIVIDICIFDLTLTWSKRYQSASREVYLLFTVFQNEKTQILTTFLWLRLVSSTERNNRLSKNFMESDTYVSCVCNHSRNRFRDYKMTGKQTLWFSIASLTLMTN